METFFNIIGAFILIFILAVTTLCAAVTAFVITEKWWYLLNRWF